MCHQYPQDHTPIAQEPGAVVMLGMFTCGGRRISAFTIIGSNAVWLDIIPCFGRGTSPLGTVVGANQHDPRLVVTAQHHSWADRPEVSWHLTHEAKLLHSETIAEL
ncbi:MAG TPA: hypothetical protein VE172_24810 [Stackebrandtia sp.]|jgi:hypothetical protein|uniref:hypothetical protein n=1 Tax=Stackebrandtia sp. TaxID=2023065 RepID=UPI002D4B95A7|nr:hypothetical protein [Stackebrandtia sp.]HZE42030.1 hypothetical protein [Stackebrandtia sp.]